MTVTASSSRSDQALMRTTGCRVTLYVSLLTLWGPAFIVYTVKVRGPTNKLCSLPTIFLLTPSLSYRFVLTLRVRSVKVGFHYPSSRAEFTGRVDGPRTRVHFLTPVNSGRELGQWKQDARIHGPCTRASPDVR